MFVVHNLDKSILSNVMHAAFVQLGQNSGLDQAVYISTPPPSTKTQKLSSSLLVTDKAVKNLQHPYI